MEQVKPKRKSSWSWKIDEADLKNQVENYKTLKITESYRGISVLIVSALLILSFVLSFFGIGADPTAMVWELVIYIPILFFVFKGHRWAIITLMILWTFEKGFQLYQIGESGTGSAVMPIIWWLIIMPYFWKALKVEIARRKLVPVLTGSPGWVFCPKCGKELEADSKFCSYCGKNINAHSQNICFAQSVKTE